MNPVAKAGRIYLEHGWSEPFPTPQGKKMPPPKGVTGNVPISATHDVLGRLDDAPDGANLALRMPQSVVISGQSYDVIGIDVDHHDDKHGGDTLAALELELGPLPTTWRNSSRAEPGHGHFFFRVPAGRNWRGQAGPSIEILRPTHRYAVAWPSVVDGRAYRWDFGGAAMDVGAVPAVGALPELPEAWVRRLCTGTAVPMRTVDASDLSDAREARLWLSHTVHGYDAPMCDEIAQRVDLDLLGVSMKAGAHDALTTVTHHVIALAAEGRHGLEAALDQVWSAFRDEVVDGGRRGEEAARTEFDRAVLGAAQKLRRDLEDGLTTIATTPIVAGEFDALPDGATTAVRAHTTRVFAKGADSEHPVAELFSVFLEGRARYLTETRRFVVWNGLRWVEHPDQAAVRAIFNNEFRHTVEVMSGQGDADECEWKAPGGSLAYGNHVAELVKEFPELHALATDFDVAAEELNTPAGIVNLRTGTVRPHDAAALHTRITEVAPDFTAKATRFLAWLRLVTLADDALIGYLQWVLGQALLGVRGAEHLFVLFGEGGSGKSSLVGLLKAVLGIGSTGYAHQVPGTFFMQTRNPKHESELHDVKGRRALIGSELPTTGHWNEPRFKSLTGDGHATAAKKGVDSETFRLQATVLVDTNAFPSLTEVGRAERRRIRAIPFEYDFTSNTGADGPDPRFVAKLIDAEGPAIAAWLCEGARRYLAQSPPAVPARVQQLSDQLLGDTDVVSAFVEDECALVQDASELNEHVYASFDAWRQRQGLPHRSSRWLMPQLKAKFGLIIDHRPTGTKRHTVGLMLNNVPGPKLTLKVGSAGEDQ
ncbi:phage/plasmid primase, P4 family [Rhodococcus sp. 05-2254-6]|uniref:phage/plasmid primase, P4 family n=1 Tax=Rhodococcus sp. 05-2254-6 TaxID=2022489 RepID=UPI0015C5ECA3|nr:phage/plasmid primase, P4 family [Rhodococcus sp. 05-2254-6]